MSRRLITALSSLLFNHVDAWGVTLSISLVCLIIHQMLTPDVLIVPVTLAVAYWLGFAVNDYFDAPFDAQDEVKGSRNFFVLQPISPLFGVGLFGVVTVASLLVLQRFGQPGWVVTALGSVALLAYSMPPLRFKTRPGLDLLMHMAFVQTFPYWATHYLLGLTWTTLDSLLIVLFLLSSLAAQLEQQLRDYDLDRRVERNFTTVAGRQVSGMLLRLVSIGLIATFLYGWWVSIIPAWLLPVGLIVLPIIIHRLIRPITQPRSEWLVRGMVALGLLYVFSLSIVR